MTYAGRFGYVKMRIALPQASNLPYRVAVGVGHGNAHGQDYTYADRICGHIARLAATY